MKKVSLLIAAFALVLGFSQCRKPNLPALNGETQHVVLNASWDNGGSKIEQVGSLLKWTTDDKLTVTGGATGELSCKNAINGTFEGTITKTTGGSITFTFQSEDYKENFKEQTGALADAVSLKSAGLDYNDDGNYGTVSMEMTHAVLKLNLSYFAPSPSKADVTVSIIKAEAESKEESAIASVKCASDKLGEVYVAVPASEKPATYTFSDGSDKTVEMSWPALYGNTFFTAGGNGGAAVIDTPKFTVAAGKTVEFAPGNLYWDGTESKFKFESNQWSTTPASDDTWDENHVSHFYWSKDAVEATKEKFDWEQSISTEDVFFTNDPEDETKPNENFQVSGEAAGTWRTLSKAEWSYLIGESNPGRDASLRKWSAVTFGESGPTVNGLIIMPDGWEGNLAATTDYTTWQSLESSGAVFLPAAGRRGSTGVSNVDSNGYYWSSTPLEDYGDYAYYMRFYSGSVYTDIDIRSYGCAVRLVR